MLIGYFQGRPVLEMFTISVSLAVAAIPEGLPIVVTVTLALGVIRMARKKAIVKKLPIVETLGCVNVICSDKTGTLTENKMTVAYVITSDDLHAEVTGKGYTADGIVSCGGVQVKPKTHSSIFDLIEVGAVCNNSYILDSQVTGLPTEAALLILAMKVNYNEIRDDYIRHDEYPFSSETKWMAVKCSQKSNPNNNYLFMKGGINEVLQKCSHFNVHGKQPQLLTIDKIKNFMTQAENLMSTGQRVIAMARGTSFNDLAFCGIVGILDPPRNGVRDSIEQLRNSGVDVKMITGDALETAQAIGRKCGLDVMMKGVVSGEELDKMSNHEIEELVGKTSIFYRTTPKNKLEIVKALKTNGYIVGMTGDGVNDAVKRFIKIFNFTFYFS